MEGGGWREEGAGCKVQGGGVHHGLSFLVDQTIDGDGLQQRVGRRN